MIDVKIKLELIKKAKHYYSANLYNKKNLIENIVFDVITYNDEISKRYNYIEHTEIIKECEDWLKTELKKSEKKVDKIFKSQKALYENEIKNQRVCFDMAMNKGDYKIASIISNTIYKMEQNIDRFYSTENQEKQIKIRKDKVIDLLGDVEKNLIDLLGDIDI